MPTIKSVALFCIKSAAFTIIFWGLWLGVVRPITSPTQNNTPSTQDAQTKTQVDAYEKQVARVNRQLDVVEVQQKRMEQNLSVQEDSAKRYDAVLKVWEKQTGLRK
jgi:hypothetical protein